MFSSINMEEHMGRELSGIFRAKMVTKNIVLRSQGTHFMHVKVKNVLRITEMFCINLILNILSSKYFAESIGSFSTLTFSFNAGRKFLHLRIVYAFFGVAPLENFQLVLVRCLKFFSAGFCIFQLVTCGGEIIFHILN